MIAPHRDERDLERHGKGQQLRQPRRQRSDAHSDLMGADHPAQLARSQQEQRIDDPEQQDRMGQIMLEHPDHRAAFPTDLV